MRLDVCVQDTVEAVADDIAAEFGELDILVNNAGIQIDHDPPSAVAPEVLRRTYETNVFGAFAVTVALLPLLRRSDAGRIVNLTSSLGSLTLNSDPAFTLARLKHLAYNSSKAALNALTIQLAYDLRQTPIKINAADPGNTATAFNNYQGHRAAGRCGGRPLRHPGPRRPLRGVLQRGRPGALVGGTSDEICRNRAAAMSAAWITLVVAGLVEVAWSQSIKPTENFTRPWQTLLCFVLCAAAVYLLSRAMDTVPVGTAYAVFTGIGAVGAILLGVVVQKDPLSAGRVAALSLIVGGVVLARVTA